MRKMQRALWRLLGVGSAAFLMWSPLDTRAGAADAPLEVIRRTTQQAVAVLDDPAYRGDDHRRERIKKMWEIILPSFDEQEIAKRSLGSHWQELTPEQRTRFTRLFIQLLKNSYSSTLDRYSTDAQFFFDTERIDGDYAEVYTRILAPTQTDPFEIVYRMHQDGERWVVHDVVAENVSLVRNYRTQFHRILTRSSFEGLIQVLEDKLQELGAL